ncbi:putative pentatricopeptide repeat-containing protein At5g37570 [Cynara cardunculus var. scolymus]|uniref:putative pentatricopeptide repeat-containing protein At5g37570 n=1 Tax=Cynara cardunculus var. scolymus TaxID=59895 RepID=UPI000D62E41F|nr:putative pentatricopeptide repeat-containing protein At5g37570 [Cynara cardunculus var. scolymus]
MAGKIVKLSKPIELFREIHKNLPLRSSPKLWHDHEDDDEGQPILRLSHPILSKLESCSIVTLREFNQVHAQLIVSGLFQHSLAAGRVVKKLCSSPSTVFHALNVFHSVDEPDSFLCNTVMRGLVNSNEPLKALEFYRREMVGNFVPANHYTFPLLVKVCAELGLVREGEKAHTRVLKEGFELDLYVRNALIHMYAICGKIRDAQMVFDLSPDSDMVTWNSMIDGYVKNGMVGLAHWLFDEMPERDVFSWNSMIAGYVWIGDMRAAQELFDRMPCRDIVSWNCLIDGYARIGDIVFARKFFDWMPLRNVVSWNTLLALYVRSKNYDECLGLFDDMLEDQGLKANEATIMSVLTACGHLGRLDRGEWVHSYIKNNKNIVIDVLLSTALLTMYAKCGAMDLAKQVFDEMPEKTVVSWNSMIMGYGMHGHGEKALEMFLELEKSDLVPNDATFVCVLSACTHAGMVLEGWWYFDLMHRVYMIEPKVEHYGCMVDLLSRAGLMKDSEDMIKNMSLASGPALWGALLSACRTHSNLELGEMVAKRLIELEPSDVGPYVLLSNIYASGERWDAVENVREMMMKRGLQKLAGSSLVHPGNSDVELIGGPSFHKRRLVYSMLSEMGIQLKMSYRNMMP